MSQTPDPRPLREFVQVRRSGERIPVARPVANEVRVELAVNGRRLLAFACSQTKLEEMALGFLWLESIVDSPDEVDLIRVCPDERLIEVTLARELDFEAYEKRRALTSGCGGGVTFQDLMDVRAIARIDDPGPVVPPQRLFDLLVELFKGSAWYRASGGMHAAALADPEEGILVLCEDLGRHNTIDKVAGECLLRGVDMRGRILLSTGRMSSDMVLKAGRMRVPILASRTSPTDLSLRLAEAFGLTVAGYVRGDRFHVYTGAERIGPPG